MLLHIRPRLLIPFPTFGPCKLVDFRLDPFRLLLDGDTLLDARRPYPNKRYLVACRRVGQKAIDGLFINADQPVPEFSYTVRWAIAAQEVVTHRVTCRLLDTEFDAASESMLLWDQRTPAALKGIPPVKAEPRPSLDDDGRHIVFAIPTISRTRLVHAPAERRLPRLSDAFSPAT